MAATNNRYADTPRLSTFAEGLWSSDAMHQTAALGDNRDNLHHHWVLFVPVDLPYSPLSAFYPGSLLLNRRLLSHPIHSSFAFLLYLKKNLKKHYRLCQLNRHGRKECLTSDKYSECLSVKPSLLTPYSIPVVN